MRPRAALSWECEVPVHTKNEIEIPPQLTEAVLHYASDTGLSVEEIVEAALKKYLERKHDHAQQ